MAFGLIRVRNLSAGNIKSTETHNARLYDEMDLPVPKNIYTKNDGPAMKYGSNRHYVYSDGAFRNEENDKTTIQELIDQRLKEANITPRKNSVLALEYVMGIVGSKKEFEEAFVKNYSISGYLDKCTDYIATKHGGLKNIISTSIHYDETTPHIHVIVLPIIKKTVKWKNQKGQGERTEKRLCARDYTGNKDKLREMQQQYYEFAHSHEQQFGIKINRGTLVEEQLNKYTQATNKELGSLRIKLDSLTDLAEIKSLQIEIKAKKEEFEKTTHELVDKIENHKLRRNGDNWKQGKDFEMGF